MSNILELKNINKSFNKKEVLQNINLSIEENKIYALLGRNAAGKTSLMNIMTTRYLPDSGDVFILGEKAFENENVLNKICFMPDTLHAFNNEKVKTIFSFASNFYNNWDDNMLTDLVKKFNIDANITYSSLSKGQKSAVSIIIGLCSKSELTMFDEVYSGLDASYRQLFYKLLIKESSNSSRTFIISTHLINEMAALFTDVIIIDNGAIVVNDNYDNIKNKCFLLKGPKSKIDLLKNKTIANCNFFANTFTAAIIGTISDEEITNYRKNDISISLLELQDIFLSLTEETKVD